MDAVVLSGGSAFGLAAADGAMAWLAARGRGFPVGSVRVPIVPAAILFDLLNGGDKGSIPKRLYQQLAQNALETVSDRHPLGNAGAGYGAKAGDLKGGLGGASCVTDDGMQVGAVVAANPFGSATMPGQNCFWAWALEQGDELGGQPPPTGPVPAELSLPDSPAARPGGNTTIGVVAVNADLTKAEALRLSVMAQDGIARAVRPAHTPFDGDTLFALATAARPLPEPRSWHLARLGALAADCVARALARGVFAAEALGPWPSYRDRHGFALLRP